MKHQSHKPKSHQQLWLRFHKTGPKPKAALPPSRARFPAQPGSFLSQHDYEIRLNAAIRHFQHKVASPFSPLSNETKTTFNIIKAYNDAHGPITRPILAELVYPDHATTFTEEQWSQLQRHFHSRLQYLHSRGLIQESGRVFSSEWARSHNRPTMSYSVTPHPELRQFACARAALYREVNHLNTLRTRSAHLMAHAIPQDARTDTILQMRASGLTLQAIADHYNVSRERIRQILGRAYFHTTTRPRNISHPTPHSP